MRRGTLSQALYCLTLLLAANGASADMAAVPRDPRYPSHWWGPVSKDGAPAWEILPQEAGPGEVILSKRNELGLLSNLAPTRSPFTENSTQAWRVSGK